MPSQTENIPLSTFETVVLCGSTRHSFDGETVDLITVRSDAVDYVASSDGLLIAEFAS